MLARNMLIATLALTASHASSTRAQDAPTPAAQPAAQPDPEQAQREAVQTLREIGQEVMRNMSEKGMDPQEFMADMRRRMEDGTFDFAEAQKQLVAKGVMDEEMVSTLKKTTQRLVSGGIKQRLGVTEDEWAVLAPKIQRVSAALANSGAAASTGGGGGRAGMGAMMMGGAVTDAAVSNAMRELRAAIQNKDATDAAIAEKLQALRDAREKFKAELQTARKDLQSVLTARQEAVLSQMGLI